MSNPSPTAQPLESPARQGSIVDPFYPIAAGLLILFVVGAALLAFS